MSARSPATPTCHYSFHWRTTTTTPTRRRRRPSSGNGPSSGASPCWPPAERRRPSSSRSAKRVKSIWRTSENSSVNPRLSFSRNCRARFSSTQRASGGRRTTTISRATSGGNSRWLSTRQKPTPGIVPTSRRWPACSRSTSRLRKSTSDSVRHGFQRGMSPPSPSNSYTGIVPTTCACITRHRSDCGRSK